MSKLLDAMRTNDAYTANGAVTHSTSLDALVDFFFVAGASRKTSESDLINLFTLAFAQDATLAMKILFWARDLRGGAGERRVFQIIMKYLKNTNPRLFNKMLKFTPEYGYWKDVLKLADPSNKEVVKWMSNQLDNKDSLLAKWFPRKGEWFNVMRAYRQMTPKALRKLLVENTKVVESLMSKRKWEDIDYEKVPSVAYNRYKKAFRKHSPHRFDDHITKVEKGEAKINVDALFPYDLYNSFKRGESELVIDAQWSQLKDFVGEGNFIPVCDVSGSMTGLPMSISVSLGVYLSERNKGIFKDAFITFSGSPKLQYLRGTVTQRFRQLETAEWGMNTNLQAVFDLVLNTAHKGKLSQEDLPEYLIIISDMEFDAATRDGYNSRTTTNFEAIKQKFEAAGYNCPQLVFWNVNGRKGNSPVKFNDDRVALVSGASPIIVKSVLGGDINPVKVMMKTILNERYERIQVS